jgi:hypothetical protein
MPGRRLIGLPMQSVEPASLITETHVRDKLRGVFVPGVSLGAVGT